ncbi:phage major capsid protein [Lacticaseibacillus sp. N501-2]|uniref:phage major capsid protein n=1 Tax=Lacticaseibacillus salsurae TaxID=3367729 RepID=UPI0038B359E4
MANPILINARLKMKRGLIKTNEEKRAALIAKRDEVLQAAEEAKDEDELNAVQKQSDELDGQIKEIDDKNEGLETEATQLESDLEEANRTAPTKKKEARKAMVEIQTDNPEDKNEEQLRGLFNFVKSNGQKRDGIVTDDLGVLVPKDIVYTAEREADTPYDLTTVIKKQSVTTPSGTYQVLANTDEMLHTVAELEANPELGKPATRPVDWKVETRRGQITYSEEDLQDVQDFKNIIGEQLRQIVANTKNYAVSQVMKTATAKSVKTLDEIKDISNTYFDPAYTLGFTVTQSGFNYLDKLKDSDGNYLLQKDVTAQTGKALFGMPISRVKDKAFGKQGDMVAFLGDGPRFARLFDRIGVSVDFTIDPRYGRGLYAAIRFDVEVTDAAAGVFITFGDAATAPAADGTEASK